MTQEKPTKTTLNDPLLTPAEPEQTLINGDCLEEMKAIPDSSVDMILCDLPYGTTANKWDSIIDFSELWNQYNRIIERHGAIVLFSSGRFTNKLINSQPDIYRYKWVWVKTKKGNFANANNRPMTGYEEITVFSRGVTANVKNTDLKMKYHPQGVIEVNKPVRHSDSAFGTMIGKSKGNKRVTVQRYKNYPCDVLFFNSVPKPIHQAQKPVALLEYLVKTYTDEGDLVLDNCMGSGSTGVACVNTNRNFIGIELDKKYFDIAEKRIKDRQ